LFHSSRWIATGALYSLEELLRNCGAINHICEHFTLLYSCCLYVDQKLIISAYQA
jgi:hypothetical protein